MIHEIALEMQTELRARGCPIPVVDGPESTETATFGRERIVIQRDGSDRFVGGKSIQNATKRRFIRVIGLKITIYAQSTAAGANQFEHDRRCEHVLDLVCVAFEKVVRARKNWFSFDGGKFVTPPILKSTERPSGSVYELACTVQRAVIDQDWDGDTADTASGVTLKSTTDAGENDIACGDEE